jgi:phage baseplate assembly protein W
LTQGAPKEDEKETVTGPSQIPHSPAVAADGAVRSLPAQRRPPASGSGSADPVAPIATVSEGADFVGRGLAWPMQVDHSGSIRLTSGPAELDSSLRLVLVTAPGERVMRPEFGCRIHELVFEPVNANTLGRMTQATREALTRWEPRIDLEAVAAVPDPDVPGLVLISIDYRVRATNDRRNLVHPFYVIPQDGD